MKAHWVYLKKVFRHKWFVFWECVKLGVPLHLAILHDWSKFLPSEWSSYVHTFYNSDGSARKLRDSTGYYDPKGINAEFDLAWLHHQKRNKHHWQYWYLINDTDGEYCIPMPPVYLCEMIADWNGAGLAYGNPNTREWYYANKDKMKLHPETRAEVERFLGIRLTAQVGL